MMSVPTLEEMNELVEKTEAFYRQDFESPCGMYTYHLFNYRLMSYSDTLHDWALEARGILYGTDGEPLCLPPHKFFNYKENPHTEILPHTGACVMDKLDGSLISSYITRDGYLRLKSRGSLFSTQAYDALYVLCMNEELYDLVDALTHEGFTVNMEYTAPDNRIVLYYDQPALTILSVRDRLCGRKGKGSYWSLEELKNDYFELNPEFQDVLDRYWVRHWRMNDPQEVEKFVRSVYDMEGIEGYVLAFDDGTWMKIKTDWYMRRHRIRDAISSDKNIAEAVLNEESDDLRTTFRESPEIIAMIDGVEEKVTRAYNHLVSRVEAYHAENAHEDRKTYAIRGQEQLDKMEFSAAMALYSGKSPDYKGMLVKRIDDVLAVDNP